MSKYDRFYSYLAELEESYAKLSELLLQKLAAVEKFDIDQIDSIIKEEQVFVLLSKGFDSNVAKYKNDLSLSGNKLSDIIPTLPEEEQRRFRDVFVRLKMNLKESKALNDKCQEFIEERLYHIDKTIKEIDGSRKTYAKGGGSNTDKGGAPTLFTKSV